MHIGPEIVEVRPVLFRKQEHRGQRRNAKLLDIRAEIQARRHVHHRLRTRRDQEAVGPGHAFAFQGRIDGDRLGQGAGAFDVEAAEPRKFFGCGHAGIHRQTTGGQAIGIAAPQRTEIAGPQKGHQLVPDIGAVQRMVQAESRDTGHFRMFGNAGGQVVEIFEIIGRDRHWHGLIARHFEQKHRVLEQPAHREGVQTEEAVVMLPARPVGTEADQAVIIVFQLVQKAGHAVRGLKRASRQRLHFGAEDIEAELLRCSGFDRLRPAGAGQRGCGQKDHRKRDRTKDAPAGQMIGAERRILHGLSCFQCIPGRM